MRWQRARFLVSDETIPVGAQLWVKCAAPVLAGGFGISPDGYKIDDSFMPIVPRYTTHLRAGSAFCAVRAAHVELLAEFTDAPPAETVVEWLQRYAA